jgi:hypothetical protein
MMGPSQRVCIWRCVASIRAAEARQRYQAGVAHRVAWWCSAAWAASRATSALLGCSRCGGPSRRGGGRAAAHAQWATSARGGTKRQRARVGGWPMGWRWFCLSIERVTGDSLCDHLSSQHKCARAFCLRLIPLACHTQTHNYRERFANMQES